MPAPKKLKSIDEAPKTQEQIKEDMNKLRTNKFTPPEKRVKGRPKGIHTKIPNKKPSIILTDEQWAMKIEEFFKNLRTTCRVIHSANLAGITYQEVLRRRHADPEFERRFQDTYQQAIQALEEEAVRRAFEGVEQPVFFRGSICGSTRNYSDSLIMFLLKGERADKYQDRSTVNNQLTGAGGGPVEIATTEQLSQLSTEELRSLQTLVSKLGVDKKETK